MITVEIAEEQSDLPLDRRRLERAVRMVLEAAAVTRARISLAVVDDPTMRRLHREYLDEDEPTDVLSFVLERGEDRLEGEVIVSGQTAKLAAARFGWAAEDELLLYVIHGTLHLVGYDDATPEQRVEMRRQERAHLSRFGLDPRYEESDVPSGAVAGTEEKVS